MNRCRSITKIPLLNPFPCMPLDMTEMALWVPGPEKHRKTCVYVLVDSTSNLQGQSTMPLAPVEEVLGAWE